MSTTDMLAHYLHRIGMDHPKDSAQQFQLSLLRQFIDHLDQVLDNEHVDPELRQRIVTQVIYGGVPTLAEAEIRERMNAEMIHLAETGAFLPPRGTV